VIRREEIAKLPANVQAIYALIDAQIALEAAFEEAANKAKAGSKEQKAAIDAAIAAAAEIQRLTAEANRLIEANAKAEADLAAAQERAAAANEALARAQAEAQEGYTPPTAVEQAASEAAAAQTALAAAMAAAAAALAPVVAAMTAVAAGTGAEGAGVPITDKQPITHVVNATVNVTGPTLDPYGDFAQRLAAALIPGLQRELARQGIEL